MLSYRSMKKNKTINEDIAAPRWTRNAPEVDEDLPISKTQRKAEADAQQALGVRLCELPKSKLLQLNLPEALQEAVLESAKITANGAMRRHKQYLGKLMRDIDHKPIEEQLARWDGKHNEENARFHAMEAWRNRLLNDQNAVTEFFALYPQADIQQLRTLIRNTQKELAGNKPPKSSRELFKVIRALSEGVSQESLNDDDLSNFDEPNPSNIS